MKTQSEHNQRWEDIIFENRNKEYGAYAIRKNNNADVLKAEAISIGIGVLIFIIPILMRDENISIPIIEKPDDGIVLRQFPNIEPIKTPPTDILPPRRMNAEIIPTRITTEDVIENPPVESTDAVTYVESSETGTTESGPEAVVSTGTGTEPIVEATKIYSYVEVMPEFEGGYKELMRFLQKNLRYPRGAERRGIQGTVYISFVVGPDGSVMHTFIEKGLDKECDTEAVRVISKMNKWKPGLQNKMPVAVKMVLPIKFQLSNNQ